MKLTWDRVHRCAAEFWTRFECPKLLRMLLGAGADPNARNMQDETPLALALDRFRNDFSPDAWFVEPYRLLLDTGADVNATDEHGSTALHTLFASDTRDNTSMMVAAMLVWRGARADVENDAGVTPAGAWSFKGGWRDTIREFARDEREYEIDFGALADHIPCGPVDLSPLIADYYSLMVARSTVGRLPGTRAAAGEQPGV